ncbi:GUN4 domain-containing protein, partial [Coleofasciculus sp. FACHB-129]|uniref:GUN4 domain-containing protein n=1 Tax=Cyanophyceae TaxID=3028117 RepID=UPI001A7EAD51
ARGHGGGSCLFHLSNHNVKWLPCLYYTFLESCFSFKHRYLFKEAVIPGDAKALEQTVDEITPEQIREMPCKHLKTLDQLWRQASGDRFGFGIQRRIWESSPVNRDYTKFGEAVGWKQNGTWLKFNDLTAKESASNGSALPIGHFPWYSWQVQEPTETEPTRFRRVGFGEWMARLKACGF